MSADQSNRPLISFVLCAFNQEAFVRAAVEGALAQTYSPLEIILSDDCSSDRTFDIMREEAARYRGPHQIILNRNAVNQGLVQHVNFAVQKLSHGVLVALAAGDDISLPSRVETMYLAWERTGRRAFSLFSGFKKIDDAGSELETVALGAERFVEDSVGDYLRKMQPLYAPGCVQVFHRAVFDRFGPLETRDVEDNNIALRALMLGGILLVEPALVLYRTVGVVSSRQSGAEIRQRGDRFRIQTYEQVLRDLQTDTAKERFSRKELIRLAAIAQGGIWLSNPTSVYRRFRGWLRLLRFCSPRESLHHAGRIHKLIERIVFIGGRVRLRLGMSRAAS